MSLLLQSWNRTTVQNYTSASHVSHQTATLDSFNTNLLHIHSQTSNNHKLDRQAGKNRGNTEISALWEQVAELLHMKELKTSQMYLCCHEQEQILNKETFTEFSIYLICTLTFVYIDQSTTCTTYIYNNMQNRHKKKNSNIKHQWDTKGTSITLKHKDKY